MGRDGLQRSGSRPRGSSTSTSRASCRELLDDALGGTANTDLAEFGELLDWLGGPQAVAELMVAEQDPKKLKAAAKKAKKAKKDETAKWLERVAGDWTRSAPGSRAS